MDACAQLRRDLRDAVAERERELEQARRRFWLGLLGLDAILDWEERGAVDRAVSSFLVMVQTGQVVLALNELLRLLGALAGVAGRGAGRAALARLSSRMVGMVALALVVMDVVVGYVQWEEEEANIHRRFKARIRTLLEETSCADAGSVLDGEGIPRP